MGMFDDIIAPSLTCPHCKNTVSDWQSKDGPCSMKHIDRDQTVKALGPGGQVEIYVIDIYYSSCDTCRTWFEFERQKDGTWPDIPKVKVSAQQLNDLDRTASVTELFGRQSQANIPAFPELEENETTSGEDEV